MNWFAILAFVVTIAAAENAVGQPVGNAPARLLLVCLATATVIVFSRCYVRQLAREKLPFGETTFAVSAAKFRWFERTRWCLWFALIGFILPVAQWTRVVRYDWQLHRLPLIDDTLILAPLFVSLLGGWFASARLDPAGTDTSRTKYALARLRDELGLALIPMTVVIVASDAGALLVRCAGIEQGRWLAYVVAVGLLAVATPSILRSLWRTSDLAEGALKDRLARWAIRLDVRFAKLRIWHTGGRMANAAVVGLLPRWRHILLTDVLVARLTRREIEAVVLHEMAHIVRRHTLWRTLALFPPIAFWLIAQEFWPRLNELLQQPIHVDGYSFPANQLLSFVFVLYSIVALAIISRLLEYDADLFAIRTLSENPWRVDEDPARVNLIAALKKLDRLAGGRPNRRTWLHPRLRVRVAHLKLVTSKPACEMLFQRRIRLLCVCLAVCPLLTACIMLGRQLLR